MAMKRVEKAVRALTMKIVWIWMAAVVKEDMPVAQKQGWI
jgi:hypothetical protein